jgi:hypothetical protein
MKLARAAQKPNGIWIIDMVNVAGRRRRISTGIKTEQRRTPPNEVKAKLRDIYLENSLPDLLAP